MLFTLIKWSSLQKALVNLFPKPFVRITPGACIIKLITAVIYGFHNKPEPLSLNTKLDWKGLPGTNTLAIMETYVRNKFYDTGPKCHEYYYGVSCAKILAKVNILWCKICQQGFIALLDGVEIMKPLVGYTILSLQTFYLNYLKRSSLLKE
jgi:hypothetical protein